MPENEILEENVEVTPVKESEVPKKKKSTKPVESTKPAVVEAPIVEAAEVPTPAVKTEPEVPKTEVKAKLTENEVRSRITEAISHSYNYTDADGMSVVRTVKPILTVDEVRNLAVIIGKALNLIEN